MIRFILACWGISVGTLPVQIGCTEHIMTIMRSDRKYFAGGVNPHDENVFGMLIETFGTLNLNISGRYYRRHRPNNTVYIGSKSKDTVYKQERPRSECADAHANLQFRMQRFLTIACAYALQK